MKLDPKLLEAQELLAYLALEDNDAEKAKKEADKAIAIRPKRWTRWPSAPPSTCWTTSPAANGWIRISESQSGVWPGVRHGGSLLRPQPALREGIAYYRKALELNPRLWEARAQLGVNLMRLGEETEARQQLEQCYSGGYKNAETVNSLRLLDSYKNFKTFKTATTILRLDKKEADLLQPYFQSELDRAIANVREEIPVEAERAGAGGSLSRPRGLRGAHDGHAGLGRAGRYVRNCGRHGQPVGPHARAVSTGPARMWHELSHVYVLTATKHRVPRWFTEGMAVYEETAAAPDWGDRLDPEPSTPSRRRSCCRSPNSIAGSSVPRIRRR